MPDDRANASTDPAIEAVLRYARQFETLDPKAVSACYHQPCMVISPQGVVALATHTDVAGFFERLMKDLQARGYKTTEFEGLKATSLSSIVSVVTGVLIWRTSAGDELERAGVTYTVRRRDSSWEIVVTVIHDPVRDLSFTSPQQAA